jgi:hypothetical protein
VDTSLIQWKPYDGIGRNVRNGLNFTERGFGIRGAVGVSDRGNTAAAALKPGDIDWEYIFGTLGVRWLHTGGIFAALSETTADVVIEAVKTAKKYGRTVIALAGCVTPEAAVCNGAGIDAFFPILSRPMTLAEAMEPDTARANIERTAEQATRLYLAAAKK